MNTIPSTWEILLLLTPVFSLLIGILVAIWKFNNNVIRRDVALKSVIEKVGDHDGKRYSWDEPTLTWKVTT